MNFHPSYRPDIDGLRAVAILLVIGFHAYATTNPAGFVGVDVFFIISGYLISSIIFKSLKHDNFSFAEFYQKRVNRITPLDTSMKDNQLEKKALALGIRFYSPKDALCNTDGCLTYVTVNNIKNITQFDICHLTDDGSVPVARAFIQKLGLSLHN